MILIKYRILYFYLEQKINNKNFNKLFFMFLMNIKNKLKN